MEPEAEAACMQYPAKHQFGLGVLSPDPGHHPGAGLFVYYINHMVPKTKYRPNNGRKVY
jgi:hypothetical protein